VSDVAAAKRRRRIALLGEIAHRASASFGGTGLNLIRLGNAFAEHGHEVDLLVAREDHLDSYAERPAATVDIVGLGLGSRGPQFLRLLLHLWRTGTDTLIVQDTRAIDLGVQAKRLLRHRLRLVCTMHAESVVRTETDDPSRERRKQRRFGLMARHADLVVGVSPGITERAGERAGFANGQLVTIPNPAYPAAAVEHARRHPVARPADARVHIISAGRLSPEKDQATLVNALARLVQRGHEGIHLTILGDGPQRDALLRQAASLGVAGHLHLPGFVRQPLDYMADADVFALSSRREAFGFVLVEALALGLPVVSTDCPYGPRFILDGGRFGRLVPVGDADALADAIAAAATGETDGSRLMEHARAFTPAATADEYIARLDALDDRP
jgi:glycosyltransferase involved in cell wall biosynthesis